jgi:hypothetical protein
MIAQRFRSVGWVAGVAGAATILYLISLQVASERGRLEDIDHRIAATKRDIRQLQTEMGTRASLRQLERWNGDQMISLSAPNARQYLNSEAALANLDHRAVGNANSAPPPAMAAVLATPEKQAEAQVAPKPTLLRQLAAVASSPKVVALTKQDRAVQQAISPKTVAVAKPKANERVALLDQSLLANGTVKDLAHAAASEAKSGSKLRR